MTQYLLFLHHRHCQVDMALSEVAEVLVLMFQEFALPPEELCLQQAEPEA
jgi:hypothetical protein